VAGRRFAVLLVLRSLAGRRTQSLLVAGSIALAVSVVATLLCLSVDVQRKLTEQLAEFGANVAFVPAGDRATFPASEGDKLAAELPMGSVVSPLLYLRAEIDTGARRPLPIVPVGTEPGTIAQVVRYRLRGRALPEADVPPSGSLPALAGSRLARDAGLSATGGTVPLIVGERRTKASIVGVITTGDSEEDQLFVPLLALEALSGLVGRRSALVARIPGRPEDVARAVRGLHPRAAGASIEVKLLRRIAATAAAALAKVRGLLALLSLVAIAASLLSAGTVLMEQAIERRGEIGLMMSLGASRREVASLMLTEAASLGVYGGLGGSVLGVGVADLLERVVFRSPLALPALVPPTAVLLGLLLALVAAALPLRASLAALPGVALKEDRP
jgi:putative ABC transport system permease protein